MSVDSYEESRTKIRGIQSRLDRTVESLRSNTSLSEKGRRVEMAKATVEARKMVDRVKAEVVTARKQTRDQLVRHLFGLAPGEGDILAMRDAQDRAAKLETHEAASGALRQAQLAGDRSMAKAITHHAVTNGWTGVVDQYVDGLPVTESTPVALSLQKLAAVPAGRNTTAADSAVFHLRLPSELFGAHDSDLERLAQDAAPQPAQQLAPM
jgi:hypothetical protein